MNFGLIVSKQHPPGVSMVDRFREHVEQVRWPATQASASS